jgi:hypothetical protein
MAVGAIPSSKSEVCLFSSTVYVSVRYKISGLFGSQILRRGVREACNDQIRYGSRVSTLPRREEEPLRPCYAAAERFLTVWDFCKTGRKEIAQAP